MRPDKTQSSIDALRILANAINNKSGIHIKRNGDIRENRFDEKILNYLGIKTTPKNWEISAKNRVIEKISADLKLLKKDTTIEGKLISNEQINEFVENYFRNVKSEAISKPIFDKIFQNINNDLLSLSKEIHGENTANFRASLALPGVSTAAAVQISMFANDLKKRWGLNSGQALTAGFQVWHLCKNNVDLNPEAAFHVVLTARKLEKKHILKPPKSHEELKINLDAAAEIVQTALALKKSHNSPYPLAHACQRYIAREQLALALPLGMKPNLIEGNPIKKRYEIPETLRNEFSTSMKKFKITAAETNTALGVTKQFHRECIGNPFEFTFPSLAENAEASSSICITHSGLEKKIAHKRKNGSITDTESSISTVENRQFDVQNSLAKLAECSAKLSGIPKKSAEIKLSVSRIFEQANLNGTISLASRAVATSREEYFLSTHGDNQYPITEKNAKFSTFLQSASIDQSGNLTQELTYFSRIYSIKVDNGKEIPVNRYINPEKPIDPKDPTTYSSKIFFTMKYSAKDLASGITKPEIQEAYVEHSFDMSSSVMKLL